MFKKIFFSLFLFLLILPSSYAENLLIMGWDGAGYNNVKPMLDNGELPCLQREIEKGAKLLPLEIHVKTETVPNWTQIFSGLSYEQSGVLGNRYTSDKCISITWDAENYLYKGLVWHHLIPYEHTIMQTFDSLGYSIGWFVSKPFLSKNCTYNPLCNIALNADSYLYTEPTIKGDSYLLDLYNEVSNFVNTYSIYSIFVHTNPDVYGHKYGENSSRYLEEIRRSSKLLCSLLDLVSPGTIFIVITDHGFDEGKTSHDNAPDGWMFTNLPIEPAYADQNPNKQIAWGTNRDIVPTLYEWLGIDYSEKKPQIRGKSLLQ